MKINQRIRLLLSPCENSREFLTKHPVLLETEFFPSVPSMSAIRFLARDSETYTRRGISGIHFLAYYCILTVHPLDPVLRAALCVRACARAHERIKDQDRRA